MNSALYRGLVVHRRREPPYTLRKRLYMLYLDLAELPRIFAGRWLWSVDRRNVAAFHREDHLGPRDLPLDEAVRDLVARRLGTRPGGPIRLLTLPRSLGLAFNPASFYYCFAPDGERLEAAVVDVTSTPWGERHAYVLGAEGTPAPMLRAASSKRLHVSPFMDMAQHYRFALSVPGERLTVAIANHAGVAPDAGGRALFDATLSLERRPLSGTALAGALLRWPCVTGGVLAAIYGHALRLRLAGARFHPHPAPVGAVVKETLRR